MANAICEYRMISDGDRILVAVSGGKDSTIMLLLLDALRRRVPIDFSLTPLLLDQKQPGFGADAYRAFLAEHGFDLIILERDTYSTVKTVTKPGKSFCGLCSRLRRGILYDYAAEHGFSKIALGHHRDDLNETVLMNMFFNGRIASMPPVLHPDDGRNTVIRPLSGVAEETLMAYAAELQSAQADHAPSRGPWGSSPWAFGQSLLSPGEYPPHSASRPTVMEA
jgi:tRNA 2-thiocytidine biosynthesis protein TtcA